MTGHSGQSSAASGQALPLSGSAGASKNPVSAQLPSPLSPPGDAPADSPTVSEAKPQRVPRRLTDEERRVWFWSIQAKGEGARLSALLLRWRCDPVACAVELFRVILMAYQVQILLDLFDAPLEVYQRYGANPYNPRRQVLVPSGHGLGKTRVLALAIWIKLITSRFSRVLITAPTSDQITGQLFGEVRKLRRRMSETFPMIANEWLVQNAAIIHVNPDFGDWCAQARTARAESPEGLQGAHALDADDEFGDIAKLFGMAIDSAPSGGILVVVEESSGVDDSIREVLGGALSEEGAQLVAVGNPTRNDGWFAKDQEKTDQYAVIPLDCRMSNREIVHSLPYRDLSGREHNLRQRGFVRPSYWLDLLADCGGDEEHDRFRVRVRGLCPRSNNEQIILSHWVDAAQKRPADPASASEYARLGLDFGLTSDKHAMAIRRGFHVPYIDEWLPPQTPDLITMEAVRRAKDAVETFNVRVIVGDANGVGRGAMEVLFDYYMVKHPDQGVRVIMFNAGVASPNKRFYRKRDLMWYHHGRKFLSDARTTLPPSKQLKEQLCTPGAHEDATKRISVESKDAVKKRTGQASGNMADALLQTLMDGPELPALPEADEEEVTVLHPAPLKAHFDAIRRRSESSVSIR